jgi:hypothetical protein
VVRRGWIQNARKPPTKRRRGLYTITITWPVERHERNVYPMVKDYQIAESLLTMAFDGDHDLVIPLFQVTSVDIVRHE